MLLGESEKRIAIEHCISVSTVAGRLARTLAAVGLASRAPRVPILLTIAAHAAAGRTRCRRGRASTLLADQSCQVVSAPRPDRFLPLIFSRAEELIVRMVVEGKTHAEIAAQRGTALRTVANQMGAIFGKVRVSGRRALLSELVQHCLPDEFLRA